MRKEDIFPQPSMTPSASPAPMPTPQLDKGITPALAPVSKVTSTFRKGPLDNDPAFAFAAQDKVSSAKSPPKAQFSDGPDPMATAEQLDMLMDDVLPNPTPENKTRALIEADKVNKGEASEGALQARAIFEDPKAQENAGGVLRSIEQAGGDVVESMGGLLSIVLPVLAGAAIGGKRGALAAGKGYGEQKLKEMDAQRESDLKREEEKLRSERDFEEAKTLEEIRESGALERKKLELEKKGDEVAQAGEKTLQTGRAKNLIKAEEASQEAQGFLAVGEDILSRFGTATKGKGWLGFQVARKFSTTELGQLQAEVDGLVFDIVKAKQGSRPSDFDVQTLLKIVRGDWTASPQVAYDLLKQTLDNSEKYIEARLEAAKAQYYGKELSKETSATLKKANQSELLAREMGSLGEQRIKQLMALQKKNPKASSSAIQEKLSARGVVVSDSLLKEFGFK